MSMAANIFFFPNLIFCHLLIKRSSTSDWVLEPAQNKWRKAAGEVLAESISQHDTRNSILRPCSQWRTSPRDGTRRWSVSQLLPCRWKYVINHFQHSVWVPEQNNMWTDRHCGGQQLVRDQIQCHSEYLFGYNIDAFLSISSFKAVPFQETRLGQKDREFLCP